LLSGKGSGAKGSIVALMTDLTRNAQVVALGEGLALGAIMNGIVGVNGQKSELEWAFRRAWRRWEGSRTLPAVNAGPSRDDVLLHAIEKSDRRRGPIVARWEGRYPFRPVLLVEGWSFDEVASSVHEQIPATAWERLVAAWLDPEGRPIAAE
jgi:hypothetical protein